MAKSRLPRNISRIQIRAVLAMPVLGVTAWSPLPLTRTSFADTISKATTITNGGDNLSLGNNWVGGVAPGSGDIAEFGNAWNNNTNSSFVLGAITNWQGLMINDGTGSAYPAVWNITGETSNGFGLTLGAGGIDTTNTTASAVLNTSVVLGSNQTWNLGNANSATASLTIGSARTTFDTGGPSQTLSLNIYQTSGTYLTIAGRLTGNGNITQNIGGMSALAALTPSYNGTITVNAGTMTLSGNLGTVNGASSTANLIVNTGALLEFNATTGGGIAGNNGTFGGYSGLVQVNGGVVWCGNAGNPNFAVHLNDGGSELLVAGGNPFNLSLVVTGTSNYYDLTGGEWSSQSRWSGSGTLTIKKFLALASILSFEVDRGPAAFVQSASNNQLSSFTGLLSGLGIASSELHFNGTTNAWWGNSIMGIDVGAGFIKMQTGGTLTLGYVTGSSELGALEGARDLPGKNFGTMFVIGDAANPVNRTFAGAIEDGRPLSSGNAAIVSFSKLSPNTLTLSGNGAELTYSGRLYIEDGCLEYARARYLGTGAATSNSDGVAFASGDYTGAADKMMLGDVTTNTNVSLNFIGIVPDTTVRLFTTNLNHSSTVTLSASGTDSNATITFNNTGSIVMASSPLFHFGGENTGLNRFVPQINGTNGVLKDGHGTWVLAASNNAYAGATTVNAGSLYVDCGSNNAATWGLTATSGLTVSGAASVFGGNGRVAGGQAIMQGGLLDPGMPMGTNSSVGTLTFAGGLSMDPGTSLRLDLTATGHDILDMSGNVAEFLGTHDFSVFEAGTNVPWAEMGLVPIFTHVGGIGATPIDASNVLTGMTDIDPATNTEYRFLWAPSSNTIFLETVPEPTSMTILGLGAAGLLLRRRKQPANRR